MHYTIYKITLTKKKKKKVNIPQTAASSFYKINIQVNYVRQNKLLTIYMKVKRQISI